MSCGNEVALITGADLGIGIESAHQLALSGISLALQYESPTTYNQALLLKHRLLLHNPGIKITLHEADLANVASIEGLFAEVLLEHCRLDMVINTAGQVMTQPPVDSTTLDHHKMFAYTVFVDEQRRRTLSHLQELHAAYM